MPSFLRDENRWTVALTALACAAFILSLSLFLNDEWLQHLLSPFESGAVIARVSDSANDVRRKNWRQIAWYTLHDQGSVYENDLLFSGENSRVELEFVSGSKLTLGENTLLNLSQNQQDLQLDLEYGQFNGQLNEKQNVYLKLGDIVQKLRSSENAQVVITKTDTGTQIEVLSGKVAVGNKTVARNQKVSITQSGDVSKVKKITIELVSPRFDETFWLRPEQPVGFRWQPVPEEKEYLLEIAKDFEFKNVALRKESSQISQLYTPDLAPGSYYWRISLKNNPEVKSSRHRFTYNHENPIELVYPPQGSEFRISAQSPATPEALRVSRKELNFVFRDLPRGKNYQLEIAADENFLAPVVSKSLTNQRVDNVPLPQGDYFWRVKAVDGRRPWAEWSDAKQFVIKKDVWTLEAPLWAHSDFLEFIIPNRKYPLALYSAPQAEVENYLRANLSNIPDVVTQLVPGAESYELEFAAAADFANSQLAQSTREKFAFPSLYPGKLYFRARATSFSANASAWSPTLEVNTYLEAPYTLSPELQQETRPQKEWLRQVTVGLQWSPLVYAKKYEVQVSQESYFSAATSQIVRDSKMPLQIVPFKTHYWRVRALAENGQVLSPFSDQYPITFQYTPTPHEQRLASIPQTKKELAKPELLKPVLRAPASRLPINAYFANWPRYVVEAGSFAGFANYAGQLGPSTLATSDLSQNKSYYVKGQWAITPRIVMRAWHEMVGGRLPDNRKFTERPFDSQWTGFDSRYRFFGNTRHGFALYGGAGLEQAKNFRFTFVETGSELITNRPVTLGSAFVTSGVEYRSYYQLQGNLGVSYYQGLFSDGDSDGANVDVTKSSEVAIDSSLSQAITEKSYLGIGLRYRLLNYGLTSDEFGDEFSGLYSTTHLLFRIFVGAEQW